MQICFERFAPVSFKPAKELFLTYYFEIHCFFCSLSNLCGQNKRNLVRFSLKGLYVKGWSASYGNCFLLSFRLCDVDTATLSSYKTGGKITAGSLAPCVFPIDDICRTTESPIFSIFDTFEARYIM
jgi:hypothetical protein